MKYSLPLLIATVSLITFSVTFHFTHSPGASFTSLLACATLLGIALRFFKFLEPNNSLQRGRVIWLTGLSGAGKSTIAVELCNSLRDQGFPVEHLDGDTVREIFPTTGFSEQERNDHIRRIGYLASILEKNGIIVVCSFISPFRSSREFVRSICKNYLEVYVSTPISICETRDVKGLYAKARRNEIKNFTGLDSPYEAPLSPDVNIDTGKIEVHQAKNLILEKMKDSRFSSGTSD